MEFTSKYMEVILTRGILKLLKNTYENSKTNTLIIAIVFLLCHCEGNDRFYRPNLPEKLSCIGIIDLDDTADFFIWPIPTYVYNRGFGHSIFFERSFQKEFTKEINDSLREFSFSISTDIAEIFNYKSNETKKSPLRVDLPDSIKFKPREKYYLMAMERDSPEISAVVSVPEAPSPPNLISFKKEMIAMSSPILGWSPNEVDTLKTVTLDFSFINNPNLFYAVLLNSGYSTLYGTNGFTFLDFSILYCNAPGFFAEIYGLKGFKYPKTPDGLIDYIETPIFAYFIDGNKIQGNECKITLSTQLHGPFSSYHGLPSFEYNITYSSLIIKLLSIPKDYFLLAKSLCIYNNVKDDPFAEPVYINGNVKGGQGVFVICRSNELKINLSPPF